MIDRRRFAQLLTAALLAPILPIVSPRSADARTPVRPQPRRPAVWNGELAAGPGRGIASTRYQTETRYGRMFTRVHPKEMTLLARSNDNQTFNLWVVMPKQKDGHWQFLEFDNQYYQADSAGGDSNGSIASFTFDRAAAERVALVFGLKMHERSRLDAGLKYRWSFPPTVQVTSTAPIPVILHVENAGATTIGFMIGGRQRGPRDNRFSFLATRAGNPLPIKVAHDFGGVGYYKPLKPGEKTDVTCPDLRAWIDFDQPGLYAIESAFEGELARNGAMPQSAAERANLWDIRPVGQGSIIVK